MWTMKSVREDPAVGSHASYLMKKLVWEEGKEEDFVGV